VGEHLSGILVAQQSVTKNISLTFVNLVTRKAGGKSELLLNNLSSKRLRGGFVDHLSVTLVAQQSVTKIMYLTLAYFVIQSWS
jgi:hypothetical protein